MPDQPERPTQRLDKWLWYARFVKSRSGAARLVADGKVRVNRVRVVKPSHALSIGDVLTFTLNRRVRVVRVAGPGVRRGPAAEAQALFEDLTEPGTGSPVQAVEPVPAPPAERALGSGRPTKKERRDLDAWRDREE